MLLFFFFFNLFISKSITENILIYLEYKVIWINNIKKVSEQTDKGKVKIAYELLMNCNELSCKKFNIKSLFPSLEIKFITAK